MNDQLIKAIRERADDRAPINTADWYVRQAIEECGKGLVKATFGASADALIKRAANQLVFSHPQMVTEKQATNSSDFAEFLPEGVEIPKHAALIDLHTLTTPLEDRDKDVLRTDGAKVDPKMPDLWQHMHTSPIGKMLGVAEHTPDALKIVSVLLDINEFTADVLKLVEAEVLRWSHGFIADEFKERKDDDEDRIGGFEITSFRILEESRVSVPSNTDGETEMFSLLSGGKLQSDYFKAQAKSRYDQRPAQAPGIALDNGQQLLFVKMGDAEFTVTTPDITPEPEPVVQEMDADGAAPASDEKRGRSLSAKNLAVLKEVRDDLAEMGGGDNLTRGQSAMCERCANKLDNIIQAAEGDEADERACGGCIEKQMQLNEMEQATSDLEDAIEEASELAQLTVERAAKFLIANADKSTRERVTAAFAAMEDVEQSDRVAAEFRNFVSQKPSTAAAAHS